MGAECYVCKNPIDITVPSFPFCGPKHHEEWAAAHYDPAEKATRHGRTFDEALARCRELGGNKAREVDL